MEALKVEGQRFKGRRGTWYLIDTEIVGTERWYMYESEQYGDDAMHLIVDRNGKELCETYDPLEFAVREALDL